MSQIILPSREAIAQEAASLHGALLHNGYGHEASALADNFGKFYAEEKSAQTFWAEIQGGWASLKRRTGQEV